MSYDPFDRDGWVAVATLDEIKRIRKKVVEVDGAPVALFWHGERVYAIRNVCIHRQRELVRGVILNGRIVCPGHQWSFDLETGYEATKCEYQPTFDVRVDGGTVYVDPHARRVDMPATKPAEQPSA